LQARPATKVKEWVIESIIGENLFEIIHLGIGDDLLQGAKAGKAKIFGVLQTLDRVGGEVGQAPRRMIIAIHRQAINQRGVIGELIAKTEGDLAP